MKTNKRIDTRFYAARPISVRAVLKAWDRMGAVLSSSAEEAVELDEALVEASDDDDVSENDCCG
jgi:hypothetical protein